VIAFDQLRMPDDEEIEATGRSRQLLQAQLLLSVHWLSLHSGSISSPVSAMMKDLPHVAVQNASFANQVYESAIIVTRSVPATSVAFAARYP
jgi:hypothetical protein